MKEIIEKYKNRKLTVSACHGDGIKMDNLDVVDFCLGDAPKPTRMTYDELTTNFSNVGAATVVTCLVLDKLIIDGDKEIAAMEKQPEYEYVPIDIKAVNEDMLDTVFIDGNGEVSIRDASVAEFLCCELYRQEEVTPARKRERKVNDLALILSKIKGDSDLGNINGDPYVAMADAAIEWMESKK